VGAAGSWQHITDQIGMFSYTGLSEKVCELLSNKYHVYLLKSGRISMAGINKQNVKYLAAAIKRALQEAQ
jgi:aspartate aminotransferase, cytoplasmic